MLRMLRACLSPSNNFFENYLIFGIISYFLRGKKPQHQEGEEDIQELNTSNKVSLYSTKIQFDNNSLIQNVIKYHINKINWPKLLCHLNSIPSSIYSLQKHKLGTNNKILKSLPNIKIQKYFTET